MLFISSYQPETIKTNGVSKKLKYEIDTFKRFGIDVDFIEFINGNVYINSNGYRIFFIRMSSNYHKTFVSLYRKLKSDDRKYDIIYFRYEHISFSMISFFWQIKKKYKTLIIGELPTYMKKPYIELSLRGKFGFYLKKIMNEIIPKNLDYIVTFSDHSKIYNTKAINIENFVDVESIRLKRNFIKDKKECHLLVLAQLTPAHGVDLVIKGLNIYYSLHQKVKCYLHVVGNGNILEDLKQLTNKYSLEEYVTFYGALGGEELDSIVDRCDIGIGALAIFRKGSYKLSELKIREYTARGLPFVYNAYEPQIEGEFFCKKLPFKNEPINIKSIITFFLNFNYSEESLQKMRIFAKKEFTAEIQLAKVLDIIKKRKIKI